MERRAVFLQQPDLRLVDHITVAFVFKNTEVLSCDLQLVSSETYIL